MLPVNALEYPRGIEMVSVCTVPARGGRSCERFGGYKTINQISLPLLKYLHADLKPGQSQLVWESLPPEPREVRNATIKAGLLTETYILQANKGRFNQTNNTLCPLCSLEKIDNPAQHSLGVERDLYRACSIQYARPTAADLQMAGVMKTFVTPFNIESTWHPGCNTTYAWGQDKNTMLHAAYQKMPAAGWIALLRLTQFGGTG